MSCRQEAEKTANSNAANNAGRARANNPASGFFSAGGAEEMSRWPMLRGLALRLDIAHLPRRQALQKIPRRRAVESRIARLNTEEKTVLRRQREARDVENRMVRMRQSVKRQHPQQRRERRRQHRQFKSHRNEHGPTVQRPAGDVQRPVDRRDPVLQKKSAQAPGQASQQKD